MWVWDDADAAGRVCVSCRTLLVLVVCVDGVCVCILSYVAGVGRVGLTLADDHAYGGEMQGVGAGGGGGGCGRSVCASCC